MYKFVVVTDPETAAGFRLAGVDTREASGPEEAKKLIPQLLYDDDTGIIAVNEDFMAVLDEKLMAKIERTYRPIIISIPVRKTGVPKTSYVERLLRKAIGYNIVLRR